MVISTIDVDAGELLRNAKVSVEIRVRGMWLVRLRARLAGSIIRAAAALLGAEVEMDIRTPDDTSAF